MREFIREIPSLVSEGKILEAAKLLFYEVNGYEKQKHLFAIFCVRQMIPYITDESIEVGYKLMLRHLRNVHDYIKQESDAINGLNVAEKYANGDATEEEMICAEKCASRIIIADPYGEPFKSIYEKSFLAICYVCTPYNHPEKALISYMYAIRSIVECFTDFDLKEAEYAITQELIRLFNEITQENNETQH